MSTLCLNMIVKNESKIITRLFDSVLSLIDCYCICDTGSTDNTQQVILEYFKLKGIPGKIFEKPFENFEFNRNFSLQSCIGMSEYILLLDSDMVLQINKQFKKELFFLENIDAFSILQGTKDFFYKNTRIVKNNGLYEYVGVTHEYIHNPQNNIIKNIKKEDLFIYDIGDGGSKTNKFDRDICLLKHGIEMNPLNGRYYFYLANSYFDTGKYIEAIETYKKRIDINGWEQEIWYSFYKIGLSYKNLNNMNKAILYWIEGYNYFPKRIENLYEIITYYRNKCKYFAAYLFYKIAENELNNIINKDDYLFLHNDIYTYKLSYELSIFGYYVGIKNMNKQYISIFNYSNDKLIINNTLLNMKFYKDILKPEYVINLSDVYKNFTSSSSCMISINNGYIMNTQFKIDNNGDFCFENYNNSFVYINKMTQLSYELKILDTKMFEIQNSDILGVKNIKIINDPFIKDNIVFIGRSQYTDDTNLGIVTGDYDITKNKLNKKEIKCSLSVQSNDQNCVYVNINNELHIIYNWYPLGLFKIIESNIEFIKNIDTPKIFNYVRGSTCGSNYKDEIWFIVHIVSEEKPKHYYHMLVIFDNTMKLIKYSAPFKFEGECIEFCLSLIVEDTRVLINYSTWDRTTKIAIYNKEYIDSITCFS